MMRARAGLVVALCALSGCLASKGDVALLQGQLQGMRDAQVQMLALLTCSLAVQVPM